MHHRHTQAPRVAVSPYRRLGIDQIPSVELEFRGSQRSMQPGESKEITLPSKDGRGRFFPSYRGLRMSSCQVEHPHSPWEISTDGLLANATPSEFDQGAEPLTQCSLIDQLSDSGVLDLHPRGIEEGDIFIRSPSLLPSNDELSDLPHDPLCI